MTYFDEDGEYWGNRTKPLIDAGGGKLTARSVKIFADGMHFCFVRIHAKSTLINPLGALRTGGAAVILCSFGICVFPDIGSKVA
jgi:hypothetical protein